MNGDNQTNHRDQPAFESVERPTQLPFIIQSTRPLRVRSCAAPSLQEDSGSEWYRRKKEGYREYDISYLFLVGKEKTRVFVLYPAVLSRCFIVALFPASHVLYVLDVLCLYLGERAVRDSEIL